MTIQLSYRQQQQLLKSYRNDGYALEVKLNSKSELLLAEIARIELLMDESAVVETTISEKDITLEQLEQDQVRYETVLPNSLTESAELEPLEDETSDTTSKANEPVSFNHATNALLPLKLMLCTLAIIIVPTMITLGWLVNVSIHIVRRALPLIDLAITTTLEYLVNLVEFLFGSDYNKYSDSYLEIKHLLRN